MKKHIILSGIQYLLMFIVLPCNILAQGINISSGGNVTVSGAATINIIDGNFVNNGTYSKGAETVTMSGTSAKIMEGSGTTTMYNLDVTNTGGITTKLPLLTATTLNVATGSKLTIDTTRAVSVVNTVTNNAGTTGVLIKSSALAANGSLIFHNAYESPVAATVEMYSKASKVSTTYKWQFMGFPVRTFAKYPTFVDAVNYVRKYNEAGWYSGLTTDKHWIQQQNGAELTPFTGYEVAQAAAKTYTFTGELVNSDYNSGKLPFTLTAQYTGQHLIANSYTGAIDISKIVFGSSDAGIIENTVYLYNTGSYTEWQSFNNGAPSATETELPGQYVSVPKAAAGTNGLPSQIPSMQAFLVMVASDNALATVSIPYSAAGTVVKNTTRQRTNASLNVSTRIDVKGTSFGDRMWIISQPDCTREFDNGWDGYKSYYAGVTQLFAMETSGDYQVNTVDNIHNTYLGFQAGATDTYTMTFTNENIESQYAILYLIDLFDNNKVTDITASGSTYTFTSDATSTPEKRFKIVTNLGTVTDNPTINVAELKIYCSQNTLFVNNQSAVPGTLNIYDIAGRFIQNILFSANNISSLPINLPAGSYILKAKTNVVEVVQRFILN